MQEKRRAPTDCCSAVVPERLNSIAWNLNIDLNKGRQKRAWVDIIADMLTIAKDGENITDIMYRTRLSYYNLKEYIELLTANGLLKHDKKTKLYTTTGRGVEYMATYKRVKSFVIKSPISK